MQQRLVLISGLTTEEGVGRTLHPLGMSLPLMDFQMLLPGEPMQASSLSLGTYELNSELNISTQRQAWSYNLPLALSIQSQLSPLWASCWRRKD